MFRLGCLLLLLLLVGIPAAAAQVLPWWGTVLVIVGEAALLLFGIPWMLKAGVIAFAKKLMGAKSSVLRGAKLVVHSVEQVPRPAGAARRREPAEGEVRRIEVADADGSPVDVLEAAPQADTGGDAVRWIRVDCTIRPKKLSSGNATPFQLYDPSDFYLVPVGAPTGMSSEDPDSDGVSGVVAEVLRVAPDGTASPVPDKLGGEQRLRITFACPEPLRGTAKLRYWFEGFGRIELP